MRTPKIAARWYGGHRGCDHAITRTDNRTCIICGAVRKTEWDDRVVRFSDGTPCDERAVRDALGIQILADHVVSGAK